MSRKFFPFALGILLFVDSSEAYSQTYNRLITDQEYYNFIDQDILRDSSKAVRRIFRIRIPLHPNVFYFKDSADYIVKNNDAGNTFFIFKHHVWGGKIFSNNLDTIFTRQDIDFFGEQFRAMKKGKTWKKNFVNSVLFDKIEYDETDNSVFGRRRKFGVWGFSLPLFSFDRRYAVIIKSNSVQEGYYIYKRNQENTWELVKVFNELAID